MDYYLIHAFIRKSPKVKITEQQFSDLNQAKEGLLEAISLEEKFDFLKGNLRDFEVCLLSLSADDMLFTGKSWLAMMDERNLVSRRLGNLLSSARMYLDHLPHHLSGLFGKDSEPLGAAKDWKSEEYDSSFAYRFMEAHRNYTQHRGHPIHRLSYTWRHLPKEAPEGTEFCLHPIVDVEVLRLDGKFKAAIIEEIDRGEVITLGMDNGLDIKPLVREYIQAISRIHVRTRAIIGELTRVWEASFMLAIELIRENTGEESTPGLTAVQTDPDGRTQGSIPIAEELVKRLQSLGRKNNSHPKAANRFVSGQCR